MERRHGAHQPQAKAAASAVTSDHHTTHKYNGIFRRQWLSPYSLTHTHTYSHHAQTIPNNNNNKWNFSPTVRSTTRRRLHCYFWTEIFFFRCCCLSMRQPLENTLEKRTDVIYFFSFSTPHNVCRLWHISIICSCERQQSINLFHITCHQQLAILSRAFDEFTHF